MKGAVAAGHHLTAGVAADILRAGGNAFDAAIGGFFAACVAEPVLASLGGGGYLLARERGGRAAVYDFFTHTPRADAGASGGDFYPVTVDFGAASQEFHIGLGACAAPGTVRGMFAVHRHLGSLPFAELLRPAAEMARAGVEVNRFQSELFALVAPIYRTESALPLFESSTQPGNLLQPGDVFHNPALADVLDALAQSGGGGGEAWFYDGELAARIAEQCAGGGYLTRDDLANYRVHRRAPLEIAYRNHRLATNPAPSAGGLLICFGLELLKSAELGGGFGSAPNLRALVAALCATCEARNRHFRNGGADHALLSPPLLAQYRRQVRGRARAVRGTTHISVIDAARNIASLTVSNGEGCGRLLPGAGFMLNNMLGEADVNPGGFHRWRPNQRMSSMMAPSILLGDDTQTALGSGGSNRIRSALLQVLSNLVDYGMDAPSAVAAPRVHIEADALRLEAGLPAAAVGALVRDFPDHRIFPEPHMFFGGVHLAQVGRGGELSAVGDPRRDGVGLVVK